MPAPILASEPTSGRTRRLEGSDGRSRIGGAYALVAPSNTGVRCLPGKYIEWALIPHFVRSPKFERVVWMFRVVGILSRVVMVLEYLHQSPCGLSVPSTSAGFALDAFYLSIFHDKVHIREFDRVVVVRGGHA